MAQLWRSGYCGTTEFSSRQAACSTDSKGAWHISRALNDTQARDYCAMRCRRCERCNYVSVSKLWKDCSWFNECDLTTLGTAVSGYVSTAVTASRRPLRSRLHRRRINSSQYHPTVLIIYHVSKTGGTALTRLLEGWSWSDVKQKHSLRSLRTPFFIDKGYDRCFFALFPTIFPEVQKALTLNHCAAKPRFRPLLKADWRTYDIAVEFHGPSLKVYWDVFEPRLQQLRLLYAGYGGTVVTTTATREPKTLIRSTYKMWPPHIPVSKWAKHATDHPKAMERGRMVTIKSFEDTIVGLEGPSTGTLARQLLPKYSGHPFGNFNCSREVQEDARRRLNSFDVVGITECTTQYWRALGHRLNWSVFTDEEIMAAAQKKTKNDWYKPAESNPEFRAFVEETADEELSPRGVEALARAASCDAPLHSDGMRKAGILPLRAPLDTEGVADASAEARWINEAHLHPICEQA